MISHKQEKLDSFNQKIQDYQKRAYQQYLLTIEIKELTKSVGVLVLIPSFVLMVIAMILFLKQLQSFEITDMFFKTIIFIALHILLLLLHEVIHALSFAFFSKTVKGISFGRIGIIALYCYNANPLSKNQYLISTLMPLITLGIFPMIIVLVYSDIFWLLQAILMILSAIGDVAVAKKVLKHKSSNKAVYLDHPTEIGVVCLDI